MSMNPAGNIISKLGGEAKVAEITAASATAPYRWQYPKERGGTGGTIPQRYHRALLDYARLNAIDLKAEDFLPLTNAASPAPAPESERERAS